MNAVPNYRSFLLWNHALKPYTTVIIAEDQMVGSKFFDLSHIVIRPYHHLGEDIGASEVERFKAELTAALKAITSKDPADQDSPVYGHLHVHKPARFVRFVTGEN